MSEAMEVSPDDPALVAEAIERAAHGVTVHLVRDGRPVADIVPTAPEVDTEPSGPVTLDAFPGADPDADPAELAVREARLLRRTARDRRAGEVHTARFGAPTLQHYRDVYAAQGAAWPGEAFVRRHHPVADAP